MMKFWFVPILAVFLVFSSLPEGECASIEVGKQKGVQILEWQKKAEGELVSFNFDNADIKLIIKVVGELTKTNFVFDDEKIRGTVTVSCPKKIPVGDTYKALQSILEVKGLAMVPSGDLVKIVPKVDAKLKSVETRIGKEVEGIPGDDRIFTQVVRLEHADVQDVWKLISALVPKDGSIVVSSQTNTIVITDTSSNIYRLLKIIQEVDKESPAGQKKIYVYYLENADPEELAKVLSGMRVEEASQKKPRRVPPRKIGVTLTEKPVILADKLTNSLVITALPRDYVTLEEVIKKLDIKRDQVLIEALIAEVSLDKISELGTELATWDEAVEGSRRAFGGTTYELRDSFETGELSGVVLGVMKGSQIGANINYYKKDSDFNII